MKTKAGTLSPCKDKQRFVRIKEMSDNQAQKMYPRSPRYVLNTKDNRVLRYSSYPGKDRSFYTEIINLSETGMAFTTPFLECPKKDEIIMVEFGAPNGQKMACYGKVVRIQNHKVIAEGIAEKECKLVGLRFVNMHEGHSKMIRHGLKKEFKHIHDNMKRQQVIYKLGHFFHRPHLYLLSAIGLVSLVTLVVYLLN